MKKNRIFFYLVVIGIAIKLFLFTYAEAYTPQSKIQNDSPSYLNTAEMLASHGVLAAQDVNGVLKKEINRTPGYPAFLAVFHYMMKIPLSGVIFLQVFLTVVVAFVIYKTSIRIDPEIGFISFLIVLYSPAVTIFSMMILSEALFLFLISIFLFEFVLYLKSRQSMMMVLSGLTLAAATYVRPIAYYLGMVVALFIFYANGRENLKKGFTHTAIFLAITYGLLGIWQIRNYMCCGNFTFSTISKIDFDTIGLFNSYARNKDPFTQGMSPPFYYVSFAVRCFMSFITRPGTLKYFNCDALTVLGKIAAYPWMVFWFTGLVWGAIKTRKSLYFQFMLLVMAYFIVASIGGAGWSVGERFRVPVVPSIAVISAAGWVDLISKLKRINRFKIRIS